jgi:ribosomal protein S18 acetylase RimI-like enzyme
VLMMAPLEGLLRAPARRERFLLDRWHERRLDEAGRLVSLCYRGHVDAEINDLYRSAAGSRQFLGNMIHFPGCGVFQYAASFVALEPASGDLRGLVLASRVADGVGHITQLCTHPVARGLGLGRVMLDQSLSAMAASGCHTVSLTVTAANRSAVRLYEQMGFRIVRRFHAHVWDGL